METMLETASSAFDTVYGRVRASAQCTATSGLNQLTFAAMSTTCRVNFHGVAPDLARDFQQEVLRWVAWFESHYSRFIPESLIGRINAAAGLHWVEVDAETDALFNLCQEMVFFTRGVFDPTALPLLKLWNWKSKPAVVPSEKAVAQARELVGWRKIQRRKGGIFLPREGMSIDLGGIGKEYAVDRVVQ
ncbi:MAG TPA: FAD:protein FMN transferase, partial [Verrucomicrobiae bacterium]|nr:FAD:protein FMN transferase [Verrucomicrobiae bacterium]